jgi:hypothetical protein
LPVLGSLSIPLFPVQLSIPYTSSPCNHHKLKHGSNRNSRNIEIVNWEQQNWP